MLRLRGEARLELGLMEEAALSFTAAREAAPQAPDGDIGLSMLALQQQDAALARSAAQRATGLDPRSTEAWTALAAAELAAGHATEALAAADTALKLDELCLPARAARVSALIALGRADEAQPVLDRLRRQNPADVRT
ncbi:MAG TPA: tetratricopeptide repeat protein, partial [Plasticicumulans sp.]|nr:tetratricopeptide repeat protein [Plasticicumulans sp.]